MTLDMDIPYPAFFVPEYKPAEFQTLLHTCFDNRAELCATIAPGHVRLEVLEQASNARELQLSGCWRTPDFHQDDLESPATKLALPFLFEIAAIDPPPTEIYTLGHSYRSLADFFMRNLFLAIGRNAPMIYETTNTDAAAAGGIQDFQRQYFYILKTAFDEPTLEQRHSGEAIEFILANSYLPVLDFSNPLLQSGSQHLRHSLLNRDADNRTGHLKPQLLEAREKMLVHFNK